MRVWISIFLFFLATQASAESLTEAVEALDNNFYKNDEKTVAEASELVGKFDPEKDTRNFLISWLYANETTRKKVFAGTVDDALKLALKHDLPDVAVYLLLTRVDEEAQNIKREAAEKLYAEALKLCKDQAGLCGRVYTAWSRYLYFVGDNPKAFQMAEQAVQHLSRSTDAKDQLHYHMAKGTLANLLSAKQDQVQAIRLAEENFDWYVQHGFVTRAVFMALNLATYFLDSTAVNFQEIQGYLERAQGLLGQIDDENARASLFETSGRIHFRAGFYAKALADLQKALPIFEKFKVHDLTAMTRNLMARCHVRMKNLEPADALLDSAEKELAPDAWNERSQILETRKELAIARKNYFDAFVHLDEYFQIWKMQKEKEDKVNLQKISADIGLELEAERNRVLQQENLIQANKIKAAEVLRRFTIALGILSLGILSLLFLVYKQSGRIKISQAQMRHILDTIDEGLVMVDSQEVIGAECSKHLTTIFQTQDAFAHQSLIPAIFGRSQMSGEDQSMIHEILQASFGEDKIAWEINEGNLPQEMQLGEDGERIIAIRWIPVFRADRILQRILVNLRDVTHERELERKVGSQDKHIKGLPDTLREILKLKPDPIYQLLDRTHDTLERAEQYGAKVEIMRDLHTQKGVARTLGMRTLSQNLHELETLLEPKTGGLALSQHLSQQIHDTRIRIDEYRTLTEVLHGGTRHTRMELTLAEALLPHLGSWIAQMKNAKLPWKELRIIDGVLNWPPGVLEKLSEVFLHAINNSLDHGFVFPLQRGEQPRSPEITVTADYRDGRVLVEITDNGVGLNLEKLQSLAQARGFVPQGNQTFVDVVFLDGVSTAETVSITSGRGVGLAAVRSQVEAWGGVVRLRPNTQDKGTQLAFEFSKLPAA